MAAVIRIQESKKKKKKNKTSVKDKFHTKHKMATGRYCDLEAALKVRRPTCWIYVSRTYGLISAAVQ